MMSDELGPHVLHMNVRAFQGGAAGVARNLHERHIRAGRRSSFAYGYGPSGRPDPRAKIEDGYMQVGSRNQAGANLATYRVLNRDMVRPSSKGEHRLETLISDSDVIHIHDVHSYWMPLPYLVRALTRCSRPVVWTLHDMWPMTGRCAFNVGCTGYLRGCGECPTLTNYPPATIDLSRAGASHRRHWINRLSELAPLQFVGVSSEVTDAARQIYPNIASSTITNGRDLPLESAIADIDMRDAGTGEGWIGIIAADLTDSTKLDPVLLRELIENTGARFLLIGNGRPIIHERVTYTGSISDRSKLAETLKQLEALVSLSRADVFSLALIEALSCGVPVLALDDPAASAVLREVGARPAYNLPEMIAIINSRTYYDLYLGNGSREDLAERAGIAYDGNAMYEAYLALYGWLGSK